MRFQVQILLVAAVCAALFHGAFSAPMSDDVEPSGNSDRTVDDNGENDENPIVIAAVKLFIKKVGCPAAKAKAKSCGYRQLSVALDRSPEGDDVDHSIACSAAKFISKFCP